MPAPPRRRKVRSTSFPATACGYCRKLRSLPCASFQIRSTLASDLFFLLRATYRLRRRFFVPNKRHRALTPLLLLSKLNPLRWASIWGFIFSQSPFGFVSGNSLRLLPKTALTSLRLLPNPKHLASDLFFSLLFTDLSEDEQSIVSLLIAVLGAALVKKHDFLATTQRARVVDIIQQAEHSSSTVETRKYSKA